MARTLIARVKHQDEHKDKAIDHDFQEDIARLIVMHTNRIIETFERKGIRIPGLVKNDQIGRRSRRSNRKPGFYHSDETGNLTQVTAEQAFLAMCHEEAELRRQQEKDATLQRIEFAKMSEFDKLCARTQAEFDALPDE
jgi:hypothetical protein